MALLIQKSIPFVGGLTLTELYLRLKFHYDINGDDIIVTVHPYVSKAAFQADPANNLISISGINRQYSITYSRTTDGSDLLSAVHNKIKDILTQDIEELGVDVDPSTGQPNLDPSTGDPIWKLYVTFPKFAEPSEVSLVDID